MPEITNNKKPEKSLGRWVATGWDITVSISNILKKVSAWHEALYDLNLTDKNYYNNYEKIKNKPIDELTRDEILTRMTYLVRAERFCDGVIEEALNDGTLEALSVRLYELTK